MKSQNIQNTMLIHVLSCYMMALALTTLTSSTGLSLLSVSTRPIIPSHLSPNIVFDIQPIFLRKWDEKFNAVGIWTTVGHTQNTSSYVSILGNWVSSAKYLTIDNLCCRELI